MRPDPHIFNPIESGSPESCDSSGHQAYIYILYDTDSIMAIINTKINTAPQCVKASFWSAKIMGDKIIVFLSDSCQESIENFNRFVIDTPIVEFRQLSITLDIGVDTIQKDSSIGNTNL